MAEAVEEASRIDDGVARARTVIAIARIQAEAGLEGHARNALRQTAEAVWRATGGRQDAALRIGMLAETAEAQCQLGFPDDGAKVLAVGEAGVAAVGPGSRVRLLRAGLVCGVTVDAGLPASAEAAVALAEQGLPARAEAMIANLSNAERAAAARQVARIARRLGYGDIADRLAPGGPPVDANEALPEILAQAHVRTLGGDTAAAKAFLAVAARLTPSAPAFAPALAAAYADAGDIPAADAWLRRGGDAPSARAAIASAYARAGDLREARRWLQGLEGAETIPPLAAIARATGDAGLAQSASDRARAMAPGRARAIALAHAAVAYLAPRP